MDIHNVRALVAKTLAQGQTPGGLAKRAGLHRNTLYGCERPDWNPRLETIIKLAPHLVGLQAESA